MSTRRAVTILVAAGFASILVIAGIYRMHRGSEAEGPRADLGRRLERLRSLPYATVTPERVDSSRAGVVVHDATRAWPGYNLYCSGLKAEAYLINMSGEVVHTWSYPEISPWNWKAVEMFDNGDILVINKLNTLIKLDWHSNLIWSRPMMVHHDVTAVGDSTLYTLEALTKKYREVLVKFDAILKLNSRGEEVARWWTYDHMDQIRLALDQSSFLDGILDSLEENGRGSPPGPQSAAGRSDPEDRRAHVYDYFHLNTVNVLPATTLGEDDSRFRPGNLLVCFRNVNQVAVMDVATMGIVWSWGEGELQWPHYPVMLESGNVLVYDNGVFRGYSRVIEVNPLSGEIEWEYRANPPQAFYSETRGAAQRLPNGNTLICDSASGRAFEVTREGETVWEWLNPAMEDGRRVQVVRMYRLPTETVDPLLAD